ncbi:MBL fold metallo-hydrolase [Neisseriaceae bacterium ESL0693]|nr:MBL fold metallo-hydrolase [Neisseriaceae bacterium ESL0693]
MALQMRVLPVTPFKQNTALLWDDVTAEAVLTDAGGEAERLLAAVADKGLNLQAIWLTHGHLDHAGGVVDLCQKRPVPVLGPHKEDAYLLADLPQITAQYHFPVSPAFKPDRWLADGDVLHVGSHAFKVMHVPGHTPGHIVFYNAEHKLLIAGDVLFRHSIGRTDFPRGNHAQLLEGIRTKLLTLPDNTRVLPGHGPMTTIGEEKQHNPYL